MTDWFREARREIPKKAVPPTANSAVRSPEGGIPVLTAVTAVPRPPEIGKSSPPVRAVSSTDEAELRRLLRLLLRHEGPGDHADFPEALALALADPVAHLECFRASARAEGLL